MYLGYNTNGFAHHRLADAVEILAGLDYGGIALTLDVHHFDPFDAAQKADDWRDLIRGFALRVVIETGARFLLDPRRKHQPTLISSTAAERAERFAFLTRAVDLADVFGADCVSFWSGTATDSGDAMPRLIDGCKRLADYAAKRGVRLAFEPEPGMLIDTMAKFADLHAAVNHPAFGLTMDVSHLVCMGEWPASAHLVRWKDWLWNVHVADMRRGVHDHLMFGEGEADFADVFAGLRAAEYSGGVFVELSRHSHDAVRTAERAMGFLKGYAAGR